MNTKRLIVWIFVIFQIVGAIYASIQGEKYKIKIEKHNKDYTIMYNLMVEQND